MARAPAPLPDDYENRDRSGSDVPAPREVAPDQIRDLVAAWYYEREGVVSCRGFYHTLTEVQDYVLEMVADGVGGALYELEQRLRGFDLAPRASEALASALYRVTNRDR